MKDDPKAAAEKPAENSGAEQANTKPATDKAPAEPSPEPEKPKPEVETPDFKNMATVEQLVSSYNEMVLTAIDLGMKKVTTVKSFIDLKTGKLACERLHAAILKTREPKKEGQMAKKSKKKAAKKTKKSGTKKPRTKLNLEAKFSWIGVGKENNGNPYRKGSSRFTRVEKLRGLSGKTIKDIVAKGVKKSTIIKVCADKIGKIS